MKTVQEYMNDPRILGDPGLMAGPEEIRVIHAIRLKQHDETAFHRKRTDAMFAGLGLPLPEYVNLSGQGKLKPRQPVTQ
jgi:hypothetical protein